MNKRAAITLSGTVDKIIPATGSNTSEKAQISVQGGEVLYREIRVENALRDAQGNSMCLKLGAAVEVTIQAQPEGMRLKK